MTDRLCVVCRGPIPDRSPTGKCTRRDRATCSRSCRDALSNKPGLRIRVASNGPNLPKSAGDDGNGRGEDPGMRDISEDIGRSPVVKATVRSVTVKRLRALAATEGRSVSATVRRLVERGLRATESRQELDMTPTNAAAALADRRREDVLGEAATAACAVLGPTIAHSPEVHEALAAVFDGLSAGVLRKLDRLPADRFGEIARRVIADRLARPDMDEVRERLHDMEGDE